MRSRRLQWNDTGAIRNSLTFWNRLALFVHLFLFVLVAGVFWGTWFSLSRSMSSISAPTFLEVGHTMIANLGFPMAVLMPATLLSAVPVLVGLRRLRRRGSFSLMLVGVGLLVVALVITLSVNVPIDQAINRWTVDTLPTDWTRIQSRWEAYHAARTVVSLAGIGFVLGAVVWSPDSPRTGWSSDNERGS
jgi:uncharacterized membrane protein